MTRDEILALARAAGLQRTNPGEAIEVVRFAALVAAKEQEACAQVCDALARIRPFNSSDPTDAAADVACEQCADAIRSRSNQ